MVEAMRKWVIVMVAVGCWLAISLTGGQRAQAEQAASSASAKKAAPRASMKKATKRSMSAMFARLPAGANTLLSADLDATPRLNNYAATLAGKAERLATGDAALDRLLAGFVVARSFVEDIGGGFSRIDHRMRKELT